MTSVCDANPILTTLDGPDAIRQLRALRESLPYATGLRELAAAMPTSVAQLSSELAWELSRLARALSLHAPKSPDDVKDLPPLVRAHWRQTQLLCGDDSWLRVASDRELSEAVASSTLRARNAAPVFDRLARADDRRLRHVVFRDIGACVANLSISPAQTLPILARLSEDSDETIRRESLRLLAAPWLFALTNAAGRRRVRALESALEASLEDKEDGVSLAALDALAVLGEPRLILACFADEEASTSVRRRALEHLASVGEEAHIPAMLRLGLEDPLAYASATCAALLAMHRRGVFIREPHLVPLLALYDAHEAFTGEELVRVSYLVRAELLALLAELPSDDTRWAQRADILAHSFGTGAHLHIAELLKNVALSERAVPRVVAALLHAAAASAEFSECELALPFYDAMPERVLTLLRAKGDRSHAPMLLADACHPGCPALLRRSLIDVLWTLSDERDATLHALAAELGPYQSGLLKRAKAHQDRRVAKLVAEAPWPESSERHSESLDASGRLKIYAESGDLRRREELVAQFRLAYRQCLAKALSGDFSAKRIELPQLEQQLFVYGRHLVSDGRRVRPWHHASPETGRDFVLQVLCEWLRETPDDSVTVALLESIGRQAPSGAVLREIEVFWRHRNPGVQRAALEAILASPSDEHGLELSISQLSAKATDTRVLVQALRGMAALGANWAAPLAARCLEHPNMSVKKEAAEALAALDVGVHAESISRQLVAWLGRHDNSGFRSVLKRALQRCAGEMQVAWLVFAAEESDDPRTLTLLCDALSGLLSKETLVRFAREERLPELIDACVQGDTRVVDASKSEVAALLHRAFPDAGHVDPNESAVYRLEVHGFSDADARAALEERARGDEGADAALQKLAGNNLAQWLRWQNQLQSDVKSGLAASRCAALILASSKSAEGPHQSTLFDVAENLGAALNVTTGDEARRWGEALFTFITRCTSIKEERTRVLRLLRRLGEEAPVSGAQRFRLLPAFGGVRTRADLECCLRQSARGPSYASESRAMLTEAFAIAPKSHGETEEETALRDVAEGWPSLDTAHQHKWLDETCARRPIDVPPLPQPERPRRPPRGASLGEVNVLVDALNGGSTQEAQEAAVRLLALDEAHAAWSAVLRAYLEGRVNVPHPKRLALAHLLQGWPKENAAHQRAAALVVGLAHQSLPEFAELHRRLIKEWLARWREGDEHVLPLLQDAGQRLLPFVDAACNAGDFSLVFLLRFRPERFLHHVGEHPEVERLLAETPAAQEEPDDSLEDPLEGIDSAGLLALARAKDTAKGLAVRAVHALGRSQSPADIEALEELTKARRPGVRSAALRVFHRIVDKERALAVSFEVLQIETRPDVALSLMRRLAHARYAPALPLLIERLSHHDTHLRQHAHRAILAWGASAIKTLRRAAKKARPDRRPAILALAAELNAVEGT
ncbi:MAG: hypothetical protein AB8H86_07100 [Polyangiales bacterium]